MHLDDKKIAIIGLAGRAALLGKTGITPLEMIEAQYVSYLGEDDIVRFEYPQGCTLGCERSVPRAACG